MDEPKIVDGVLDETQEETPEAVETVVPETPLDADKLNEVEEDAEED